MPRQVTPLSVSGLRLGDAVALAARPVAAVADAVLGTHLGTCGGCARRRLALNAAGGSDAREWPPADEAAWI